jgi:hypothetical protein
MRTKRKSKEQIDRMLEGAKVERNPVSPKVGKGGPCDVMQGELAVILAPLKRKGGIYAAAAMAVEICFSMSHQLERLGNCNMQIAQELGEFAAREQDRRSRAVGRSHPEVSPAGRCGNHF